MSSWSNPCGAPRSRHHHIDPDDPDQSTRNLDVPHLLKPLLIRSKNALTKARQFSEEWVEKTFHLKVMDHHNLWSHRSYEWVPSHEKIPKRFGEDLSQDILTAITEETLEATLRVIYRNLLIYADGLARAQEDQRLYNDGSWAERFDEMRAENKGVLCELSSVLWQMTDTLGGGGENISDQDDADNLVQGKAMRSESSASSRNLRDWFIMRDYITSLEYLIQVCAFFASPFNDNQ